MGRYSLNSYVLMGILGLRNLFAIGIVLGSGAGLKVFDSKILVFTGFFLIIPLIALLGVFLKQLWGPVFTLLVAIADLSVIGISQAKLAFDPSPLVYDSNLLGVSGFVSGMFIFVIIYGVLVICAYRELRAIRRGE